MEPPGETHTLEVPDDVDEMYTLFHVTGACVYVDPFGKAERIEDVFTKLEVSVRRRTAEGHLLTLFRWQETTMRKWAWERTMSTNLYDSADCKWLKMT